LGTDGWRLPEPEVVSEVSTALDGVPRVAYSVPHVYPSAAPAYEAAPELERPAADRADVRLYVHLPYCRYRCSFCYFAVKVGAQRDAMERYVGALQRELAWIPPGSRLSQLFVGGGTPTALPADLLDDVLSAVFGRVAREGQHVHTIETSPETLSQEHLDVIVRHGMGRVSMGVQSLVPDVLETVHRKHEVVEALAACELLVASGLVVNVDLIYGLPGQSPDSFLADLTTLAGLGVPAITCYSLRVTERTPVSRAIGHEPFDLGHIMAWRAFVKESAESLGYTQTRWHTFKRLDSVAVTHERLPCFDEQLSGFQLGVGMSARSHLGHAVYRNHPVHDAYIERIEQDKSPVQEVFRFDDDDRLTQFVARSLGDGNPLVRAEYGATFGRPIDEDFGEVLGPLRDGGLVDDDGEVIVLSERGKLVYDLVTLAFYPERARAWLGAREPGAAFVSAEPLLQP
jgi:oxygen-independent coproporphyrinogen III oxidase